MRVLLDDERQTPDGWVRVYWPDEAIRLFETGQVEELSLDHDLGDESRGTGYDVVVWIEEAVAMRGFRPPWLGLSEILCARHNMTMPRSMYATQEDCTHRRAEDRAA